MSTGADFKDNLKNHKVTESYQLIGDDKVLNIKKWLNLTFKDGEYLTGVTFSYNTKQYLSMISFKTNLKESGYLLKNPDQQMSKG